jgi:glycosyltransferase involved in cell wall biosynthesis
MDASAPGLKATRVSVIMLTYNRAGTIGTALESVRSQTFADWECIVIDDGSTDETQEVVEGISDPRIRYVRHEENAGVIARRNEAFSLARGEYVACLDSDDRWIDASKLEQQVAFLDTHPEAAVVGTQAVLLRSEARATTAYPTEDAAIRRALLFKNVFVNSSCLIRKAAIPGHPYRPEDYLAEDYGLWLRLGEVGKLANLPDAMTEYAVNQAGQMQRNLLRATRQSLAVIRRYRDAYPGYRRAALLWRLKIALRGMR